MESIEKQKSLPELVYDAVLNAVCEGTLRPGERLTQEGVAGRLDVSRLPVGQALKRLQSEGFLHKSGRRRLEVAPLDARLVRDLYGLRSGIDMACAGEAARHITRRRSEEGQRLLDDGFSALEAGDIPLMIAADCDFHWFVYQLAGNRQVLEVMTSRWHHMRRVMIHVIDDLSNQWRIWREHEAILAAIRAGDPARAERLARDHVDDASAWLQEAIAERASRAVG